jgi:hypothetical protein
MRPISAESDSIRLIQLPMRSSRAPKSTTQHTHWGPCSVAALEEVHRVVGVEVRSPSAHCDHVTPGRHAPRPRKDAWGSHIPHVGACLRIDDMHRVMTRVSDEEAAGGGGSRECKKPRVAFALNMAELELHGGGRARAPQGALWCQSTWGSTHWHTSACTNATDSLRIRDSDPVRQGEDCQGVGVVARCDDEVEDRAHRQSNTQTTLSPKSRQWRQGVQVNVHEGLRLGHQ